MSLLTAVFNPRTKNEHLPIVQASFMGPASYATGGEGLDFATDLGTEVPVSFINGHSVGGLYSCEWDSANLKTIIYVVATGAEVAAAVDLSAVSFLATALLPS